MIKQQAFTLIELSIVLVIIGLIVGGILVGQDLIRQAELRAVISEMGELKTAMNTFRVKYNTIPGDLKNADVLFGLPAIENGNGNRSLDDAEETMPLVHLSLAGMISGGPYVYDWSGSPLISAGVGYPSSARAGWVSEANKTNNEFFYKDCAGKGNVAGDHVAVRGGQYYFNLVAWGSSYCASSGMYEGVLSPLEAHSIDAKIDDGEGDTGKFFTEPNDTNSNCLDGSEDYILTSTTKDCMVAFRP